MPEYEIVEILGLMVESINLIRERFSRIQIPDDFVSTSEGLILFDYASKEVNLYVYPTTNICSVR